MKKIERKQYTVTGYNFKEISRGKGSIEYQLMDENGNERMITAMAKLNIFNKISSIRPIYHREFPLIERLAQAKLNDSISLDFEEFNSKNPRGTMRKQKTKDRVVRVNQSGDGLSALVDSMSRPFQLMLVSIVVLLAFTYLV